MRSDAIGAIFGLAALLALGGARVAAAGPSGDSEAPVDVRIELAKTRYVLGEAITFAVTSNRDCYFLVFTIDPDGKVEVHDPVASGDYMGHPLLKAGERRQIPTPDAPGRAVVGPPAGRYEIGAVCGRDELSKLGLNEIALKEPAKAGRRSFQFHLDNAVKGIDVERLGRSNVTYDVTP